MTQTLAQQLGLGWYLDWAARPDPFRSSQAEYMPMIRLRDGGTYFPSGDALLAAIDAQPGALWHIGNEPDVKWQDNTPSDLYAQLYHELYHLLKTRDPSCRVAIGGVSQPTPLRLAYLDQVLAAYEAQYGEPMPVDVWNVHNFILREERDSWGVGIPPGIDAEEGLLYEIADHDDLTIFKDFPLGGAKRLQLRIGFFNIFNQAFADFTNNSDIDTTLDTDCNVRVDGVSNGAGGTASVCDPTAGFVYRDNTLANYGKIITKRGRRAVELALRFFW